MLQKQSYLEVADNSGAKSLQIFHVVGSTGKVYAYPGDIVICAVKSVKAGGQVKKGDVVRAVIVRTRKEYRRSDGSYIRFGDNAGVLIKSVEDPTPLASRMFGPIARELRARGFTKIISLAPEVI